MRAGPGTGPEEVHGATEEEMQAQGTRAAPALSPLNLTAAAGPQGLAQAPCGSEPGLTSGAGDAGNSLSRAPCRAGGRAALHVMQGAYWLVVASSCTPLLQRQVYHNAIKLGLVGHGVP